MYENDASAVGSIDDDLNLIPIVNFCKETTTFPKNAFITDDDQYRNIFVLKVTEETPEEILQIYAPQD